MWGSAGKQLTIGGTSAVAPLWAAWKALTDAVAGKTLPFGPQVGGTEDVQQITLMLSKRALRAFEGIATLTSCNIDILLCNRIDMLELRYMAWFYKELKLAHALFVSGCCQR